MGAARSLGVELALWDRCTFPLVPVTGQPARAFTDGDHVVLLGRPPREGHDCTALGCSPSVHVLYRGRVGRDAPLCLGEEE